MTKKIYAFVTVLMILLAHPTFSQDRIRCGTSLYMDRLKAEDPDLEMRLMHNEELLQQAADDNQNFRTSSTIVTVPVVFHILYRNSSQNISQVRILDQLAVLNADYARQNADTANTPSAFKSRAAGSNIQFCLAQRDPNGNATTGIIRKAVTVTGFDPISNDNVKYSAQGGDDAWPSTDYLNIWVCNFTGNSSLLLGISQLPGTGVPATDGCCVLYSTVGGNTFPGTLANFNTGRTLTHEVGHWFSLRHTWGDDNGACTGTDYVSDTPNQSSENYGCPTYPQLDNCTNASPGVMFMSYMDYVDDLCMNMFSTGQASRMNNALNVFRSSLASSIGCLAPVGIADVPFADGISVFPNPSSGMITLSGKLNDGTDMTIRITNMMGELIYSTELKNISDFNLPIDLSGLAQGVYSISLTAPDAVVNKKFILTRS